MTTTALPTDDGAGTPARLELAAVQTESAAARAELFRLQRAIAATGAALGERAAHLVEANEQLILAALKARGEAERSGAALAQVARSAGIDALTGLPNRALLLDRLVHSLAESRRRQTRLALLFLDLDGFKSINDRLGHSVGDLVLQRAAASIVASVRAADTVSRYGGDEFLVLLSDVSGSDDAVLVASKVIEALRGPHPIGGQLLHLSTSIGISMYPDDGDDAATLIERADAAMYRAKRSGPGRYARYNSDIVTPPSIDSKAGSPKRPVSAARLLREANEQLLLTALQSREREAESHRSRSRQSTFLASVVHELRQPLSAIRNAAAVVGRLHEQEPATARMHGVIDRQIDHLSHMVDDLLDLSRAESGKLRIESSAIDLRAIAQGAVAACSASIEARHQALVLHWPAIAVPMVGDPTRLRQVISNLLDNASRYTPEGGHIVLELSMRDGAALIAVSDDGIGIPAEALPHVFDPFLQDKRAVLYNIHGLGLGLTLVRELARAHGGEVTVRSDGAGRGSRFEVRLPLGVQTQSGP